MSCFFFAIGNIGLAEATLLNTTSPLFIGILAVFILNEKMTLPIVIVLVIGFLGVAMILKPGTDLFTLGATVGLLAGFIIACIKILIRYISDTEPVLRTVFYFSLYASLFSAIPLIWFWQTPSGDDLLILIAASTTATFGQLMLTYAFTHNPTVKVAPFSYTAVFIPAQLSAHYWSFAPVLP